MRVYLAGTYSRDYVVKLYLAGNQKHCKSWFEPLMGQGLYILESFYWISKNKAGWILDYLPQLNGFMLDSGAFTFMENKDVTVHWDDYVRQYADLIKKHNIDQFFELDIDSVVGLQETERLRNLLESLTGKQCIPVWHKSRGKDYWKGMVRDYGYVAIGGIVSKEITRTEHRFFPWFITTAHEQQCQIHGLGYTNMEGLKKYAFDSVDSTAWIFGNRPGVVFNFDGKKLVKRKAGEGQKIHPRDTAIHNFNAWAAFANSLDKEKI